jgi:MFS superfamily sulfate permease-like transporter
MYHIQGLTFLFQRYDLLYEWLFEIRGKIFLSEYAIVWATFLAIQVVGMDAGIVIGVLVSIIDHVIHSATTTGVNRVNKRSRAVWTPEEHKLLHDHGYHSLIPKIVTLGMSSMTVEVRVFTLQLTSATISPNFHKK